MIDEFFAYARERHAIYLRRAAGAPPPWTDDPILRRHKFCNIFRELDRTTAWFRDHVRGPLRDRPEVLLATVVFRWFNRISTGEAIFCQTCLPVETGARELETAFDTFLRLGETGVLRRAIVALCPDGPWVTGSYTINTRSAGVGLSKLDGVLKLIEMWLRDHLDWRDVAENQLRDSAFTMEEFCQWARGPCLADFMTYEIACDLRHTALLEHAPDIMTWANLGPGARRGLNRIFRGLQGRDADRALPVDQAIDEMQRLLAHSRQAEYWPQGGKATRQLAKNAVDYPRWELREVEHTLCEFDKYRRVIEGTGRPRGSFNG